MKKTMKVSLAILLIISILALPTFAQSPLPAKVKWMIDNGHVKGRYDNGKIDYALDEPINRAEVSKILVTYAGYGGEVKEMSQLPSPFSDVSPNFWAKGFINVASQKQMIKGYPEGDFKPRNHVTYAELSAMLVRLDSRWSEGHEVSAIWPDTYLRVAAEFGILEDIHFSSFDATVTRQDAFSMIYNAIHARGSQILIQLDLQDPEVLQNSSHQIMLGSPLGALYPLNPSRQGYTFVGWNRSPDGNGEWVNLDTIFEESTVIYAIWDEEGLVVRSTKPFEPLLAKYGTSADDLSLPEYVTLYLSNGRPVSVPVTWDTTTYNANRFGQQVINGSYEPPKKVTGGQLPPVQLTIVLFAR